MSISVMPSTPATRIAASGLVQSMSPWPRRAAVSRKARPSAWASSGMRAAVRPPLNATDTHRLPNSAMTVATMRAVSGVSVQGQRSIVIAGTANASRATSTTAPPTPPSSSRERAGIGVSATGTRALRHCLR